MTRSLSAALMLFAACSSTDPAADAGTDAAPARDGAPDATAATDADAGTTPGPDGALPDADPADSGPEVDGGFDLTRPPSCPGTAAYMVLFHGRAVDQAGAGLPGTKAQMCIHTVPADEFLCIQPADTRADGTFTVVVPNNARCMRESTMRFVTPRTARAATYCKIDLARSGAETTSTVAYSLFDTAAPRTLPPLGTPETERTVVFADGLEVDLTPFDFFADYESLTGARVPLDHPGLCFLQGQAPFEALYAFSPEGDIQGRADVRVPNSTGLAAGTAVRGYVLGSLGCTLQGVEPLVPEGEWEEFGRGQVSADGQTISISPGLPCLGWFAYRAE